MNGDNVTLPDDMDWLKIPPLDDSNVDSKEAEAITSLLDKFVAENEELQEYIKDFPEDEGFSENAKEGAVYTIVRRFLLWLHEHEDPSGGIDYNLSRINPTPKQ